MSIGDKNKLYIFIIPIFCELKKYYYYILPLYPINK